MSYPHGGQTSGLVGSDTSEFTLSEELVKHDNLCLRRSDNLETVLFRDPLLVLKIPDVIDALDWDEKNTIPFIYVGTNQLVRENPQSDSASIVGIHASGITDRYISGTPKYFPLVLKNSEELLIIDREFVLSNGMDFSAYHDFEKSMIALDELLTNPIIIEGAEKFLVSVNDLVALINAQSNRYEDPHIINNCNELCI